MFLIPLFSPINFFGSTDCGNAALFGEAILQEGLVLFYGLVTILLFCIIPDLFGVTVFLFQTSRSSIGKGTSIRPEYLSCLVGFLVMRNQTLDAEA